MELGQKANLIGNLELYNRLQTLIPSFLREYSRDSLRLISHLKTSGTVTPSSKYLIHSLLRPIDLTNARCVVELGPGNGCVTREILARLPPDALLISFEVESAFALELRKINDRRLCVFEGCATRLREVLDTLGVDKVDAVVSSLPLSLLPNATVASILASVGLNLEQGGQFLQYQYSLSNYAELKPLFRKVRLSFTLRNVPPAFVYDCLK